MEIMIFCNGQMFGEERHVIIHQKREKEKEKERIQQESFSAITQQINGQGAKDELADSVKAPFSI